MKTSTLSAMFALALLGLASCSKQYDVTTSSQSSINNNTVDPNNNFDWTGTPPFSAKVDGAPFLATEITVLPFAGYYGFTAKAANGSNITPSIPMNAIPGQIYSIPTPANLSWEESASPTYVLGGSKGKLKIVTNDATTIEGYFWADVVDYTKKKDTVVHLTQGYFKITKP